MQKNALKSASTYYLIGTLFNKGFAFLTVPIFTRILSTADYGVVTTYDSWIGISSVVIGFAIYMGIRSSFVDYPEKVDDFLSVCVTFTLMCGIILIFAVGVVLILFQSRINYTLVFLCLLQGLATAIVQDYSTYLMMRLDYKFRTMLMVVPNLLSSVIAVVAILFILKTKLYMGKIVPMALVNIGMASLLLVLAYRKSKMLFNKKYLNYALKISAPLVLHGIALNILSQSDRTMITVLGDASQTGIYSLIYNFGMIAVVITTALEGIWVPWFYNKLKENAATEINCIAKDYVHLMTYLLIGVIAIGPEIVKFLASNQYWEGIKIIPPIVLSNFMIFVYTLYVNIEHYHGKTVFITLNTFVAAGSNLILNYFFIPKFGYVAAAYTTLLSYSIAFAFHARYAKRLEPELFPIQMFIASFLQLAVTVITFYFFRDVWYVRFVAVLLFELCMLRKERDRIAFYVPSIKENGRIRFCSKN